MKSKVCRNTSVAKILKITSLQVFPLPIRLSLKSPLCRLSGEGEGIEEIPFYKSLILNKYR